jgi:hypothetical protein
MSGRGLDSRQLIAHHHASGMLRLELLRNREHKLVVRPNCGPIPALGQCAIRVERVLYAYMSNGISNMPLNIRHLHMCRFPWGSSSRAPIRTFDSGRSSRRVRRPPHGLPL